MNNKLTQQLNIRTPIIQAPMSGGPTTPQLIAAVSEAGGLGSLGAGYLSGAQIRQAATEIRALTRHPFAINLFAPDALTLTADPDEVEAMLSHLAPYHRDLGLPEPTLPERLAPDFAEQFDALLAVRPDVFSFTFGLLPEWAMVRLKAAGIITMGTATTAYEGQLLAEVGVDAVIAQTAEAGGHRGTFAVPFEDALISTKMLIPRLVEMIDLPVIASGGIMTGHGISTVLAMGASGVQLGTAFLVCTESGAPDIYKQTLLNTEEDTEITTAFSGRPARGLRNRVMDDLRDVPTLPYPVQNALTRAMRSTAKQQARPEFMSLWAGQGVDHARAMSASELMATLMREMGESRK